MRNKLGVHEHYRLSCGFVNRENDIISIMEKKKQLKKTFDNWKKWFKVRGRSIKLTSPYVTSKQK